MLKSLSLLSVSAVTLLASTQAYSHVLCAPNNPQVFVGHSHNLSRAIPRIQPMASHTVRRAAPNPNQQRHLQAQRARQQKALANQQRINQQRRAQAQRIQQQVAARKAQQIKQQQAAAQQARVARQQAAQRAAQAKRAAQYRAPVQQAVHRQPVQRVVYRQPAPQVTYYQAPAPVYVAPVTRYVPARTSVSFQVNTSSRHVHTHNRRQVRQVNRHPHRVHRSRQVLNYPTQPRRVARHHGSHKQYRPQANAHKNYQWKHNAHRSKTWHK